MRSKTIISFNVPNQIPPASPLNAAWIVKRLESHIADIEEAINKLEYGIEVDGKKMVYNNEYKCRTKSLLRQTIFDFELKAKFYRQYYPTEIFNQYYNLETCYGKHISS